LKVIKRKSIGTHFSMCVQPAFIIGTNNEDGTHNFAPITWVSITNEKENDYLLIISMFGTKRTKQNVIRDTPHNCAQTIHVIPADQNFEKKCNSNALFAREISLVTQPSFDCEQGINSQVQTVCSNADAVFPVLGIVFCKNERFSLSRKTHVPLWNEPMISHVRLP